MVKRSPAASYPAEGGRVMKDGLKPYWGGMWRPKPRLPPIGTPGMPAATAGGGATIGVAFIAEDSCGAAPVQAAGTVSPPT